VRSFWKPILSCLALAGLVATAGCGGSSENASTASIGGPGGEKNTAATGTKSTPKDTPAPQQDPMHPRVVMETSLGRITLQLDREKAPLTVDNFLSYVENGHYDLTIFHQVIKDYPKVVIGGAFSADMVEKATRTPIRNEAHNGLKNQRATIAMARRPDAIDSATCHFFINLTDNVEMLDHKDRTLDGYGYCAFGRVVEGMEVVDKIGASEVHDSDNLERTPVKTVLIKSMRTTR